jgi:hypothetical protein
MGTLQKNLDSSLVSYQNKDYLIHLTLPKLRALARFGKIRNEPRL